MLNILTNFAHPCKACTNVRISETYIPTNHEYWVNVQSLNGWVFQNHFDCVASAIAGGIHACMGINRGNSLFTTKDIVRAMEVIHCEEATKHLKKLMKSHPKEDWDEIKKKIVSFSLINIKTMATFTKLILVG